MLRALVGSRDILVCAGPGGVGKTTTAAAVGALAARLGKRTLVCTIDPAPRLADALGVGTLGAEPRALSAEARRTLGIEEGGRGELLAARLDTEQTFARLVRTQVPDPAMQRRIFENPIYRQITSRLTGSQEYAATLALHDFYNERTFDLIVLDTPPTANALDFLEAPRRIAEAATSPALQWFARPASEAPRFSLRRLRAGGALAIQRLGKFVGSQFLDDLGAFLSDFHVVLAGFLERARAIEALLRRPEVGFLLVTAPETPALNEALYFHGRLKEAGLLLDAFIANRVMTAADLLPVDAITARVASEVATAALSPAARQEALTALRATADHLVRMAEAHRRELERLGHNAPGIDVLQVPLLSGDVSSLASLRFISERLAAA